MVYAALYSPLDVDGPAIPLLPTSGSAHDDRLNSVRSKKAIQFTLRGSDFSGLIRWNEAILSPGLVRLHGIGAD